jgi:hypothetical protein
MKTRKIILLASILILTLVLVLQLVLAGGSKIRYLNLKDEPAILLIEKSGEVIKAEKKSDELFILNDSITADTGYASTMFSEIQAVKIIDTVANSVTDEAELERYGLTPLSLITVTAQKDGKILRTMKIGKAASSGAQTYAQMDNSNNVVLVSGYLRSYYEKSIEELTQKEEAEEEADDSSSEDGDLLLNSVQE